MTVDCEGVTGHTNVTLGHTVCHIQL